MVLCEGKAKDGLDREHIWRCRGLGLDGKFMGVYYIMINIKINKGHAWVNDDSV